MVNANEARTMTQKALDGMVPSVERIAVALLIYVEAVIKESAQKGAREAEKLDAGFTGWTPLAILNMCAKDLVKDTLIRNGFSVQEGKPYFFQLVSW